MEINVTFCPNFRISAYLPDCYKYLKGKINKSPPE